MTVFEGVEDGGAGTADGPGVDAGGNAYPDVDA